MATSRMITLGICEFEILTDHTRFLGIGTVSINGQKIRSGRLPLLPFMQSFKGQQSASFDLIDIKQTTDSIVIQLNVSFKPVVLRQTLDWNLDHTLSTSDWDTEQVTQGSTLELHITKANDSFDNDPFEGFAYHWNYNGTVPLYWLLDRASWEIDGAVTGSTVYSQSLFSDPTRTFDDKNSWTSELAMAEGETGNHMILQCWPRFMSLQPFDFQFKKDAALVGVFEKTSFIRSVLKREAGAAELKVLDWHLFNQSKQFSTVPKKILISAKQRTLAQTRNLWSTMLDTVNGRAGTEFGMKPIQTTCNLSQDFWSKHTFNDYRTDLLPATIGCGLQVMRIGNVNRTNASEGFQGNQCESHEYIVSDNLGGTTMLKQLVDEAAKHGIKIISWTSTAQSPQSPLFHQHHGTKGWFVKLEDGRQVFGGTHSTAFQFQNLAHPEMRKYWVDSLKKIKAETGIHSWFWDMAANVSYIAINYDDMVPTTMWRESLEAVSDLQKAGIEMDGLCPPFVRANEGGLDPYKNWDALFLSHRLVFNHPDHGNRLWTPEEFYRIFAHGSVPALNLFYNNVRIDKLFTDDHRRILKEFQGIAARLQVRVLRDDNAAVEWREDGKNNYLICNLTDRICSIEGTVVDISENRKAVNSSGSHEYELKGNHTYEVQPTK